MNRKPLPSILAIGLAVVLAVDIAPAADPTMATRPADAPPTIRAELRADQTVLQVGRPVWVTFSLTNLTNEPMVLRVPDAALGDESAHGEIGLPLAHVFSGTEHSALSIRDTRNDAWDKQVALPPRGLVPVVRLGPQGSVGLRLELTQYYPSLKRPGKYSLVWHPYGGKHQSQPLEIHLLAERQAIIHTDFGTMTVRFHYAEAPLTVQNFIELVEQRFYDNLTFHKVWPYSLVLGGDPRGDGRGVRPDGKRLKAEFSDLPFDVGTVGMARLPRDPDSASCQFFICASRQPSFDGDQTAFGYLHGEQSFETLRKIASIPTDSQFRPRRPVAILAVTLENVPPLPGVEETPTLAGDERPTTRPAIIPVEPRGPGGLSQLNGRRPTATRPSSDGG